MKIESIKDNGATVDIVFEGRLFKVICEASYIWIIKSDPKHNPYVPAFELKPRMEINLPVA